LVYLLPNYRLTPYLLGGGGWYYTHVRAAGEQHDVPVRTARGRRAAALLSHHWSVDASYRYVWNENIHSQSPTSPVGKNFSDSGYELTTGLNFHF